MFKLSKKIFKNIFDDEWNVINNLIKNPSCIMVYDTPNVRSKSLVAISLYLEEAKAARLRLYVYHDCSKEIIYIRDWSDGFGYDTKCPTCHTYFTEDNTLFELEAMTLFPIEIIE